MLMGKVVLACLALLVGPLLATLHGPVLSGYTAVPPSLYAVAGIPNVAGMVAGVSVWHHLGHQGGSP